MRLLTLLLVAACARAAEEPPPPPRVERGPDAPGITAATMRVGGYDRRWQYFVPVDHDRRRPAPLLLVLHGGLGSGSAMPTLTENGFERCAERDGGIVVYPDGLDGNWNDDRIGVDSTAHLRNVDDVGFIRELIATTAQHTAVDPKRVYVTGMSNGAMMCYRLARELPGTFAAIAPVAGLLPAPAQAKPWPEPVSVLLLSGTDDPMMPFAGGGVGSPRSPRGTVISAAETVRFLVAQARAPEAARELAPADPDPRDGTTWRGRMHGADGAPTVAVFDIVGGGHTWPGGRQYVPERIVGRTSRDIDACQLIWDFCLKHPRP